MKQTRDHTVCKCINEITDSIREILEKEFKFIDFQRDTNYYYQPTSRGSSQTAGNKNSKNRMGYLSA